MKKIQTIHNFLNMGYAFLLQKTDFLTGLAISKPFIIRWDITLRCNLNCKMCVYDKYPKNWPEDLSTDQIIKIMIKLRKWLGPFNFHINGGEPLIRKDIFDMIKFIDSLGIRVMLHTNGTLINKKNVKKLINSGVRDIRISLNGLQKTQDKMNRRKGSYKKIINAIKLIKNNSKNVAISIHTVLMKDNLDEIAPLVELVKKYNLTYIALIAMLVKDPTTKPPEKERKGWYKNKEEIWPDAKKIEQVINQIIDYKRKGYPIHNSISHLENIKEYYKNPDNINMDTKCTNALTPTILPNGIIRLCWNPIGDLKNENPKEIWNSNKAKELRKNLLKCKRSCSVIHCNDSTYIVLRRFIRLYFHNKFQK